MVTLIINCLSAFFNPVENTNIFVKSIILIFQGAKPFDFADVLLGTLENLLSVDF